MTPNKEEQKKLLADIMEQDQKNGLYKQQTAVDWVAEQIIRKYPIITQFLPNNNFDKEIIEQAKQMEKERASTFGIRVTSECYILKNGKMEVDLHKFETLLNEMYGE